MVASSISRVDNVEHIYVPQLPAGRYDLEVLKHGGGSTNFTTAAETYALAFEFFSVKLTVTQVGGNILLSWPIYPDGFELQADFAAPGFAFLGLFRRLQHGDERPVLRPDRPRRHERIFSGSGVLRSP